MNDQDFVAWLNQAKPGECQPYHVGMLCADRHPTGKRKAEAVVVGKLARAALAAGEDGLCHLLQRRLGEGKYEYIAIRSQPTPVIERRVVTDDTIRSLRAEGLSQKDIKIRLGCSWTRIKAALEE